jgi:hypothetical protein
MKNDGKGGVVMWSATDFFVGCALEGLTDTIFAILFGFSFTFLFNSPRVLLALFQSLLSLLWGLLSSS